MKKLLTVFIVLTIVFVSGSFVFEAKNEDLLNDFQSMEKISGKFLDSYLKSVYVDETLPVDYSDFVDNENLIDYMEAKKAVYGLTEKYFGEIVDFNIELFTTGATAPYRHGHFCYITIYTWGTFNNSEGKDLKLPGSMVFTFIEVDGKLKIYGVYSRDIIDYSVRGYSKQGEGFPTVYKDLSKELQEFAVDFEKKLSYMSENKEQIEADKNYCTDLAVNYLSKYYEECYNNDETDGIFEHDLEIESGALASYLQKIAYYENSPKRYGNEMPPYEISFKVYDPIYWDGKIYCEVVYKIETFNRIHPLMRLSEEQGLCYFTFTKNSSDKYILSNYYKDAGVDRILRIHYPFMNLSDYIIEEDHFDIDTELLSLLDAKQFAQDDSLRLEMEKKQNSEAETETPTESPEEIIPEEKTDSNIYFTPMIIGVCILFILTVITLLIKRK